jgi:hypothetical protein
MQQQRRRNRVIIGVLSLGLLAGAVLTASSAQAFVSGPGPYYAEPAWDQIKGAGRFLILTNWSSEAVLDKETGLVWEKSPTTSPGSWGAARAACLTKTTGNRKGWRLPAVHELASLIDPSVTPGPTLSAGHPFIGVLPTFYWSATEDKDNPAEAIPVDAWSVGLVSGVVGAFGKSFNFQAWCVRGGNNADQY